MIFFGWYSFLLKKYMLHELGIPTDERMLEHMQVEVRQKCFHVFWIPLFSIGKMYALRRGGQLYGLPNDMVQLVRMQNKHKTPWYTYIGLILIATALLYSWADSAYSDYQRRQNLAKEEAERKEWLANPTVNDYYMLQDVGRDNYYYAKIEIVNKDSVLLKVPLPDEKRYQGSVRWVREFFDEDQSPYTLEWIAKEDIRTSIESAYSYGDYSTVRFYEIGADSLLIFREVMRDLKKDSQ